jgi:hypothetical protein
MTNGFGLLDSLWASTLDEIRIDILRREVQIQAHAQDGDILTMYLLQCRGVRFLRYEDASDLEWEYIEITEAEAEQEQGAELTDLRLEFWVSECELRIKATEVELTETREDAGGRQ